MPPPSPFVLIKAAFYLFTFYLFCPFSLSPPSPSYPSQTSNPTASPPPPAGRPAGPLRRHDRSVVSHGIQCYAPTESFCIMYITHIRTIKIYDGVDNNIGARARRIGYFSTPRLAVECCVSPARACGVIPG